MPTATEEDWATIARRLAPCRRHWRATPRPGGGRRRRTGLRGPAGAARRADRPPLGRHAQPARLLRRVRGRRARRGRRAGRDLDRAAGRRRGGTARLRRPDRADAAPPGAAGRRRRPGAVRPGVRGFHAGTDLDLEETYAWGWRGAGPRSRPRCGAVAEQIVARRRRRRGGRRARRRPGPPASRGTEALRAWMQELADRAIDDAGRHPLRHPRPGAPASSAGIAPTHERRHLLHRPERGLQPARAGCGGRCPRASTDFSTWREVTTVYHEGVPGHHLQIAQTAYRAALLNRWQRLLCWCSGHGEGWALYAERLMAELGYLDDPGDRLGMLDAPGVAGRPRRHRHRHAPGAADPGSRRFHRASAGPDAAAGVPARSTARMDDAMRIDELQPLPRLAGAGAGRTRSASGSGWPAARRRRRATAPRSTSRPSTARRSTWARSASTRSPRSSAGSEPAGRRAGGFRVGRPGRAGPCVPSPTRDRRPRRPAAGRAGRARARAR